MIPETPPSSASHGAAYPERFEEPSYAPGDSRGSTLRTHIVRPKETLFSLARQYYNDESKWRVILEANRGQISDKNVIRVGQELLIPD